MRVEVNERLVRRNRRIAQYAFLLSVGIWLGGLGITLLPLFNQPLLERYPYLNLIPTIVLPVGLIIALFAVHMTNLWVREPRPEQAIRDGLKGISSRSRLYHYYHSPAKHVLIAPQGVFAIVVRFQNGNYRVEDNRWRTDRGFLDRFMSTFRLDGIGNPSQEAQQAAEYLQGILGKIHPGIEVQPLVVFTDSAARITIEQSKVPVLYADEKKKPNLKDYMRRHPQQNAGALPLTPEEIATFESATLPS